MNANRIQPVYLLLLFVLLALPGCQALSPQSESVEQNDEPAVFLPVVEASHPNADLPYLDASLPVEQRVADLLARMTLEEKIGQMTQVEKNSIFPEDITSLFIGSLLSGGGGSPEHNNPESWAEMTDGFQRYALQTRLGIPLIYGVDAIHGHGNLFGATIFPQNIGLGATRDPDLVERIGRATAVEMVATGAYWNFAPVVAAPQDIRWGRTYEGYSEDTDLVSQLGAAYVRGQQSQDGATTLGSPWKVIATPKHYIGDGATTWGTSTSFDYKIDQGDMRVDEETLRARFLPPYQAAIEAGAMSVMVSFSSWNGLKMHANHYLITGVLKGELGFQGFVVSDWAGIDQIPGSYQNDIVTAINAGLDMVMVPEKYGEFIQGLTRAVYNGSVPIERIDDAVTRILRAKFMLGLFEHPYANAEALPLVGSPEHRQLAAEAVQKSLVLLKNNGVLPISRRAVTRVFVGGSGADDIGMQCGGWTITWQGQSGNIQAGSTILEGIQNAVTPYTEVVYDANGVFISETCQCGENAPADYGILVLGEQPYSEGEGDREDLTLTAKEIALLEKMRQRVPKLVVILISGRPLVITEQLPLIDALVAAWQPGTEGAAIAEVLFGEVPFTGKLPYSWPRWNSQLPFDFGHLPEQGCDAPLFPLGYGLEYGQTTPDIPECPAP